MPLKEAVGSAHEYHIPCSGEASVVTAEEVEFVTEIYGDLQDVYRSEWNS